MKQILYLAVIAILVISIDSRNYASIAGAATIPDTSKNDLTQLVPIVRKPRGSGVRNYLCCGSGDKSDKSSEHSCPELPSSSATPAQPILPPVDPSNHKITLVLDLDETLLKSSCESISNSDHVINVEIEGQELTMYIKIRPHLEEFLRTICHLYDCVIFTAGIPDYAIKVSEWLSEWGHFIGTLSRDHCTLHQHEEHTLYIKDLDILGRDLNRVVIVDNSPVSFLYQKENAILVDTWEGDENDQELMELIPFLRDLSNKFDIFPDLKKWRKKKEKEAKAKRKTTS